MTTASNSRPASYAFTVACALVLALVVAGCTTTTSKPQVLHKPAATYDAVIVGDVKIDGELWQHLLPHFRHGMVKKLRDSKAFGKVVVAQKTPGVKTKGAKTKGFKTKGVKPPGVKAAKSAATSSIVVSGRITKIDKGNATARLLIGAGAGKATARGTFTIRDNSGNTLATFRAAESYSGGLGIGGWTIVQMEKLLQKLGASTAQTVVRWSKGEDLKPASVDDKPGP